MRLALAEGRRALGEREVPVGCVLVSGGAVLAAGANRTNAEMNATRHAELVAADVVLRRLGRAEGAAALAGCELFVTVEPCIMCASALQQLGVRRVVFGCRNDRFGGCGTVLDACVLATTCSHA